MVLLQDFILLLFFTQPLMSLKCYQSGSDARSDTATEQIECSKEYHTPACGIVVMETTENNQVVTQQSCWDATLYCGTFSICNDKDDCNVGASDTINDPTIKIRTCKCHDSRDQTKLQLNPSNREDYSDCAIGSGQHECNVTALINETAGCLYGTFEGENGTYSQECYKQAVDKGPLFHSGITYTCDTDLCNVPVSRCGVPLATSSTGAPLDSSTTGSGSAASNQQSTADKSSANPSPSTPSNPTPTRIDVTSASNAIHYTVYSILTATILVGEIMM